MLHSGRRSSDGYTGFANAADRFDHVFHAGHNDVMYDNRISGQASYCDFGTGVSRTKLVHGDMDDRDAIRESLAALGRTREELASALKTSVHSVGRLLRKERRLTATERDLAERFLGPYQLHRRQVREIPVIGEIGAGWREASASPVGWEFTTEGGPNTFALVVRGNSMDRVVRDGAKVAVDPDDRSLVSGKVYAVLRGSEATFKRYLSDPARLEPMSNDPRHRPIIIGDDDFRVIGRVVLAMGDPSDF